MSCLNPGNPDQEPETIAHRGDLSASLGYSPGLPVRIMLEAQPPVPGQITSISDAELRERAREAWLAAFRLESISHLWMVFPMLYQNRQSIDGETQQRVSQLFPSLRSFGEVLTKCAARGDPGGDTRAPWFQELYDLVDSITSIILDLLRALAAIEIDRASFDMGPPEEEFRKVAQLRFDSTQSVPLFEVDPSCLRASAELRRRAAGLRKLLAITPASTLRSTPLSEPLKPRWDRNRRELWLGQNLLKVYKRQPAPNQLAILNGFEELGWPPTIDDPIPPLKQQTKTQRHQRLKDAVRPLQFPGLKFRLDGSAKRVRWEASTEPPPSSP
jgi:hypothetical protein